MYPLQSSDHLLVNPFAVHDLTYHVYGFETSGKRQPCSEAIEHTWAEYQVVRIFEQLAKLFGTGQWF